MLPCWSHGASTAMHTTAPQLREELTLKAQVIDKEKRRKDKLEKDLHSCQVRACPSHLS